MYTVARLTAAEEQFKIRWLEENLILEDQRGIVNHLTYMRLYHNFVRQWYGSSELVHPGLSPQSSSQLTTVYGTEMVYRHGSWRPLELIHFYGVSRFHNRCDVNGCTTCDEMSQRVLNMRSGIYDGLRTQTTGTFDHCTSLEECLAWHPVYHIRLDSDSDSDTDDTDSTNQLIWTEMCDDIDTTTKVRAELKTVDDFVCSICMENVSSSVQYVFGCQHIGHIECVSQLPNVDNCVKCPECRQVNEIDTLTPEVGCDYMQVEFATSNELGELDYSDPVSITQFVVPHKVNRYCCYVLTGTLQEGTKIVMRGIMREVKLLSNQRSLWRNDELKVSRYEYKIAGDFEVQIISMAPVEFSYEAPNVKDEVERNTKISERVLLVAFGTYGDVTPIQSLQQELEKSNIVELCDLSKLASTQEIIDYAKTTPHGIDLLRIKDMIVDMNTVSLAIEKCILAFKPTRVIGNMVTPGLGYMCQKHNIKVQYVSSIPMGIGAHVYSENTSIWQRYINVYIEKGMIGLLDIIPSICAGEVCVVDRKQDTIFTVAPELCDVGVGNIVLPNKGIENGPLIKGDIFVSLGSCSTPQLEQHVIDVLQGLPYVVHMQVMENKYVSDNIIFITGYCNHESLFEDTKVVITTGGSGTVQCALRHGCRVLVVPTMIDQKFWPGMAQSVGLPVAFLKEKVSDARLQIHEQVMFGRGHHTLTSVSPMAVVNAINNEPEISGVFIYRRNIKLQKSIYITLPYHYGIGEVTLDGYRYMEVDFVKGRTLVRTGVSKRLDTRILAYMEVSSPYDLEYFKSLVKPWTIKHNCREVVLQYTSIQQDMLMWTVSRGEGIWVDTTCYELKSGIWHEFKQRDEIQVKTPSMKVIYDPPKDGYCLYNCIRRVVPMTEDSILLAINDKGLEMGYDKYHKVPYYDTLEGDWIPQALAEAYGLTLYVFNVGTRSVISVGHGPTHINLLRTEDPAHYQLLEVSV